MAEYLPARVAGISTVNVHKGSGFITALIISVGGQAAKLTIYNGLDGSAPILFAVRVPGAALPVYMSFTDVTRPHFTVGLTAGLDEAGAEAAIFAIGA